MRRLAISLSVFFQVFVFSGLLTFTATPVALANSASDILNKGLNDANGTGTDSGPNFEAVSPSLLIGRVITSLLGLTGLIFVGIVIWGGLMYMLSSGDATKVEKAKKMMIQAVIGLIIIGGAYTISSFVIAQLSVAVAKT